MLRGGIDVSLGSGLVRRHRRLRFVERSLAVLRLAVGGFAITLLRLDPTR
jgi:hypothetical protein